jgi:N-acylneuraminate cytidylyltransferase
MEFILHYLQYLDEAGISHPRLIVHLRPTTPLREVSVVDAAIQFMLNTPEASSLRSMQATSVTPYKLFRLDGGYARPFMDYPGEPEFYNRPRQFFEPAYDPNGYVDILRPSVITNEGKLHGDNMKLWVTDPVADIDVDDDYEVAKNMLGNTRFAELLSQLDRLRKKVY